MRTHNYLARIDDEIWLDLYRLKQLDGRSINCDVKVCYLMQKAFTAK